MKKNLILASLLSTLAFCAFLLVSRGSGPLSSTDPVAMESNPAASEDTKKHDPLTKHESKIPAQMPAMDGAPVAPSSADAAGESDNAELDGMDKETRKKIRRIERAREALADPQAWKAKEREKERQKLQRRFDFLQTYKTTNPEKYERKMKEYNAMKADREKELEDKLNRRLEKFRKRMSDLEANKVASKN